MAPNWPILPERACDGCDVCCVALTIDEPGLRKPQGIACKNLEGPPGSRRCQIHATRPETCRVFYCGWRMFRWVNAGLRPDISGLLVMLLARPDMEDTPNVVIFTLLNEAALDQVGCVEAFAAAISANLEVHLSVQGPPGRTAARARIDGLLAEPVRLRDRAMLLHALREGYRMAVQGQSDPVPVGEDAPGEE